MKKYLLFVSLLVGIFFTSCKMGVEKKESDVKTGVISLNLQADIKGAYSNFARTVGPVDWDLTKVTKWTVKFNSSDYSVTKEFDKNAESTYACALPVGTYTIEVEGTVAADEENNIPSYVLYGKVTGQVLPTTGLSTTIPVSLKKTAEGKGEFNYSITLSSLSTEATEATNDPTDDNAYTEIGNYQFNSYLTSVKNSNNKTPLKITGSKADKFKLEITGTNVNSGFYYFTIEYAYKNNNYVVPLKDALVEIADGQTTKAEITDSDFEGVKVKNIYVDNNEESDFNGSIPDYVAGFNKSVSWLKEHQGAWTTANLYFIRPSEEAADFYDLIKAEAPYYDVSVNPTSSVSTEPGFGKTVNVYVDGALNYMLYQGTIGISPDCDNNMKIYLQNSGEKKDVTITALDNNIDSDSSIKLLLNNTTATISGVNLRKPNINVYIPEAAATAYDSKKSEPILTIKPYGSVELSDENIKLNVVKADSSVDSSSYTILSKTANTDSDKKMYCYTALAGQAGVSIVAAIPEFTIEGSSELEIKDKDETYKCCYLNSENEKVEFDNSVYTIEWSLNGKTVGTNSSEFTLNPTTNKYVKTGENNLLVVVSKDGEYRSVNKIIKIMNLDSIVLWNSAEQEQNIFKNGTDGNSLTGLKKGIQIFNAVSEGQTVEDSIIDLTTEDSDYENYIVKDFEYDKNGDLYVILYHSDWGDGNGDSAKLVVYDRLTKSIKKRIDNIPTKYYSDSFMDPLGTFTVLNNVLYFTYPEYNNRIVYVDLDGEPEYDENHGHEVIPPKLFYASYFNKDLGDNISVDSVASDGSYLYVSYRDNKNIGTDEDPEYENYIYIDKYDVTNITNPERKLHSKIVTYVDDDQTEHYLKYQELKVDNANVTAYGDARLRINDMYFIDNNIYALMESCYWNAYSRGGLVKLEQTESDISLKEISAGTSILGWYNGSDNPLKPLSDVPDNRFYGPRKFVALKSDALYIADEGFYYDDGDEENLNVRNTNRVVTINLSNFDFSAVNVNATLSGYFDSTSCNFVKY